MILYLVQHGKAVDKKVDPDRPLTQEGAEEVETVARFLAGRGLDIAEVWHSGKTRARQTAERLAKQVAPKTPIVAREGLAPDDEVRPLAKALRKQEADIAIVGHLPFLSRLASALLAGDEAAEIVRFRNAGVVCLERDGDGRWHVVWVVTPELAR
jgi:phosphohistidine phosphatase